MRRSSFDLGDLSRSPSRDSSRMEHAGFHAELDIPIHLDMPAFGCCTDLSQSELEPRSLASTFRTKTLAVENLFPKSILDFNFGTGSEEVLRYKFQSSKASAFAPDAYRPRPFLSMESFIGYLKLGQPFVLGQLQVDIKTLDFFFSLWLEDNKLFDLSWLLHENQLQEDRSFLRIWGNSQFQNTSKKVTALSKAYPQLALRFYFHRNNPEAMAFAHIHLGLISLGRPVTQPRLPWLLDQYGS